jgi:hypothetical protein
MKHKVALVILSFLCFSPRIQAQTFSIDSGVTSDSQVLDSGTSVFAFDFSGAAVTVNGVGFSDTAATSFFTLSGFRGTVSNDLTGSTLSTFLNDVLASSTAGSHGGGIDLSGLTSGLTYQLQLFTAGAGTTGSETVSDVTMAGTTVSGDLYYGGDGSEFYSIIDTFVASGSDENITFTSDDGSPVTLSAINFQQVDETSNAEDAPEPGTMPFFLAGMVLLGLAARRHRLAA